MDQKQNLTLREAEVIFILQILQAAGGNKKVTAKVLGIHKITLRRKLKKSVVNIHITPAEKEVIERFKAKSLLDFRQAYILHILYATLGNRRQAAKVLGVTLWLIRRVVSRMKAHEQEILASKSGIFKLRRIERLANRLAEKVRQELKVSRTATVNLRKITIAANQDIKEARQAESELKIEQSPAAAHRLQHAKEAAAAALRRAWPELEQTEWSLADLRRQGASRINDLKEFFGRRLMFDLVEMERLVGAMARLAIQQSPREKRARLLAALPILLMAFGGRKKILNALANRTNMNSKTLEVKLAYGFRKVRRDKLDRLIRAARTLVMRVLDERLFTGKNMEPKIIKKESPRLWEAVKELELYRDYPLDYKKYHEWLAEFFHYVPHVNAENALKAKKHIAKQIKARFRELVRTHHPDYHPSDKTAAYKIPLIKRDYEILKENLSWLKQTNGHKAEVRVRPLRRGHLLGGE